jgi:PAS domain-containing protein
LCGLESDAPIAPWRRRLSARDLRRYPVNQQIICEAETALNANQEIVSDAPLAIRLGEDLASAPFAPILAGARARGMADALEMLGVAAIFVRGDGSVLFANDQAGALLGSHLRLSDERLQAGEANGERRLRRMMDAVLGDRRPDEMTLGRGAGRPRLRLRATPVLSEETDRFQLVKAVIVLDVAPERRRKSRAPSSDRPIRLM